MPKDHENMPLLDGPLTPTEPQAFAPEQLVQCEKCHRSNPPTRVNCLYCGHQFAFNANIASIQKPTLRPLEKWEQGFSSVFLPAAVDRSLPRPATTLPDVANLLKLGQPDLQRILEGELPLPLARTASMDEALLIERRLRDLGVRSLIVSDADLRIDEAPPIRIRAAEVDELGMWAHQSGGGESVYWSWNDLRLVVQGRITIKSLEVQEQSAKGRENQILDALETFSDEAIVDLYSREAENSLRIMANSFDFSCLGSQKALVAIENFKRLLQLLTERAPQAVVDDSFKAVRQLLEPVWSSEKHTGPRGWRRARPGKYLLGSVTEANNERQFTRYSRLRNHFFIHPHLYEIT